ncbi:MAG: hypothetical protein Unbinned579contig1003_19 [Prokaryotic dsDNA virus sp.]|nr:MAG: hypothetical protein Unbinned579contig1003_19 [Prokaryotic dsDNA virus sp.]|tara:strand:+ start:18846 stop:19115 length:270 start_codon:yes stop_codon:yes gene_type:complete
MIKFICECGEQIKELQKATIKVIDGKVRTEQAQCKCGKWMQEFEKDFQGFPGIIRTEPTLDKKRNKMWKQTKEKLVGKHTAKNLFNKNK